MPVCPVCENPQAAGESCDVCGHPLASVGAVRASVSPVDGFEPTGHASAPYVPADLPELEPTLRPQAASAPGEGVEGLESTRLEAGPDLAPEPLDLVPTAEAPVPGDGAAAGPISCRYCRAAAVGDELLCLRCGMRLPRRRAAMKVAAAGHELCPGCGTPVAAARCAACGARAARP